MNPKPVYFLGVIASLATACHSPKDTYSWDSKYGNNSEEPAETYPVFKAVNEIIAVAGITSSVTLAEEYKNGVLVKTIKTEYRYNADGDKISEIEYNEKGEMERSTQYTYNSHGKEVSGLVFDHLGDTMYSIDFIYDSDSCIRISTPNPNCTTLQKNEKKSYVKTYYNAAGKDSLTLYDIGYGYDKIYGYDYDEHGQIIRYYSFWSDGSIAKDWRRDFYYSGECIIYYYAHQKRKIITTACPNQTERIYKFYGNTSYHASGVVIRQYKGGYLRVTFNEFNLITLREYFDNQGNMVARITTTYQRG